MIFVDELIRYPNAKGYFKNGSCHLFSDQDNQELINFAKKIGLKTEWLQNSKGFLHFDLVESKRKLAVKNGAKEVTCIEMIKIYNKIKELNHESK